MGVDVVQNVLKTVITDGFGSGLVGMAAAQHANQCVQIALLTQCVAGIIGGVICGNPVYQGYNLRIITKILKIRSAAVEGGKEAAGDWGSIKQIGDIEHQSLHGNRLIRRKTTVGLTGIDDTNLARMDRYNPISYI